MTNAPSLSVVVCTWNRPALLKSCLDSLEDQTLGKEQYEVIVVFSHQDDLPDAVRSGMSYRMALMVIHEPEPGLSRARNRGWQEASGECVAFIDDDARADRDWAARILECFSSVAPQPVAVGGDVYPVLIRKPPFWFSDVLETFSFGGQARFLSSAHARYGFIGANMAFPRDILARAGGFSPAFGMAGPVMGLGEETELFTRLDRQFPGRFWYDPALRVRHCITDRQLHILSRCFRSFYSGRTLATIDAAGKQEMASGKKILGILRLIPSLPLRMYRFRRPLPAELVLFLQDFSERTGYLFPG